MTLAVVTDIHLGPSDVRSHTDPSLGKRCSQAKELLSAFLSATYQPQVEGAVVLGDLFEATNPVQDSNNLSTVVNSTQLSGVPVGYAQGNHEEKNLTERDVCQTLGVRNSYYSYDVGDLHVVILNPRTERNGCIRITIDNDQLNWLRNDLRASKLPSMVFSHEPLSEQGFIRNPRYCGWENWGLVANRKEVRRVLNSYGNVVAVVQGHLHWNSIEVHAGIPYLTIQSLVELIRPNKAAGSYCLVDLQPDGAMSFRIFGKDLELRRSSSEYLDSNKPSFTSDDFKVRVNSLALQKLNTLLGYFNIEREFLQGLIGDYEQVSGRRIFLGCSSTQSGKNKNEFFDLVRQGLFQANDIPQTIRQIFSDAHRLLKARGLLQIDFLAGKHYLQLTVSDSQVSSSIVPLQCEHKLISLSRAYGFIHLDTITLDQNAQLGNYPAAEFKSAVFMKRGQP